MTISSQYAPVKAQNSGALRYAFMADFAGTDSLDVYKVTDSARLLLQQDFHYWVDVGEQFGPHYSCCDIVLAAPLASDAWLEVLRRTETTSDFSAEPLKSFPADAFERTLDQLCMAQQDVEAHACDCRGDEYQGIPEVDD